MSAMKARIRKNIHSGVVVVVVLTFAALPLSKAAAGAHPRSEHSGLIGGASSHAHFRLRVVAGSSTYVVYTKRGTGPPGHGAKTARLYYRRASGPPHLIVRIGEISTGYSLAGSILLYSVNALVGGSTSEHWVNLATGAHGRIANDGDDIAAVHGWITLTRKKVDGKTATWLTLHHLGGSTTSLGTAYPGGANYGVTVAGKYLIAYNPNEGDGLGTAEWMAFVHPDAFHEFIPKDHQGGIAQCVSATATRVACAVTANRVPSMRAYSVTGKLFTSTPGHCPIGGPSAVLHNSVAWVGQGLHCSHQLRIAGPDEAFHKTHQQFTVNDTYAALGGVVLPSKDGHQLELFTSATAHKTIVRTH